MPMTFSSDMKSSLYARLDKRGERILCGYGPCSAELGKRGSRYGWAQYDSRFPRLSYRSPYYLVALCLGYQRKDDGAFDMTPRALERKKAGRTSIFRRGSAPSLAGTLQHVHVSPIQAPTTDTTTVWCWDCQRPNVFSSEGLRLVDWSIDPRKPHIQIKLPPT